MDGRTLIPSVPPPAGSVPTVGRSPITGGAPQRLVYDGRLGELYPIFIVNFLLGLVTLGIYRFWGKTRMRRYLWSHVSYDGDRLEYTGTGGEMFKGFLLVAVILTVLVLGHTGLQILMVGAFEDPMTEFWVNYALSLLFYGVLFFLILLGQYTALRYRLSRTRWRGIKGGLSGSAWRYAWKSVGYFLLQVATLAQFTPFATVRLWRYRIDNIFFGTERARFSGSGRAVYRPFLVAFLASLAATAVALGGAGLLFGERLHSDLAFLATNRHLLDDEETQSLFLAGVTDVLQIIGMFIAFSIIASLVSLVAHCWYWTKLLSLLAQGTTIAGLRFVSQPRTVRLWWLLAGNFLLGLFTLGFGLPIVLHRMWRFVADNVEVVGAVDGAVIAQNQQLAPSRGEGLLEALDPAPF
jgi:uncharacterized membrane protein YjgN (DUF898 family)